MKKQKIYAGILAIILIPILRTVPALAHGDKIVPHVVDGVQLDGIRYRTKLDITNLSWTYPITRVTVLFFGNDGQPWSVSTNQGFSSSFPLNLGTAQTIRIETLGNASIANGFVIVRNLESATDLPDDYDVSITAYYEISQGSSVTSTFSIPIGQPSMSFSFPVEIDSSKGLNTGFAIVNLTDTANNVTLQLFQATSPPSNDAAYYQSATLALDNGVNKKVARFLDQTGFFPGLRDFKGVAFCTSNGPVALLALLQTPTASGPQYATLVPAYLDAMRRNTMMYFPQGYSLDADIPVVDYFRDETAKPDAYYEIPWDLLYQTLDTTGAERQLTPQGGTTVAVLGSKTNIQFDAIGPDYLRGLSYTTNAIDLRDASGNLYAGFTFAVRTGLGRYAKVRIRDFIGYTGSQYQDLMLEIYVYK